MSFLNKYAPYWPSSLLIALLVALIIVKPFIFRRPRPAAKLHMHVSIRKLAEPIQFAPCPHCGHPDPKWMLPYAKCSQCGAVNEPLKKSLDILKLPAEAP